MGSVNPNQAPDTVQYIEGNKRTRVPVYDSSSTTQQNGNQTLVMDFPMRELFVSNDSTGNMTIVVTGNASLNLGFMLLPSETINERLPLFTQVVVNASGLWRYYVRGGRVI